MTTEIERQLDDELIARLDQIERKLDAMLRTPVVLDAVVLDRWGNKLNGRKRERDAMDRIVMPEGAEDQ